MVSKGKTKKKTNETIKRELQTLSKENDDVGKQGRNKTVNNVNNSQEAIFIICHYEDIIKTQNKEAIAYSAKERQLVPKTFLIMSAKANRLYILKIRLMKFWRNTLCLKHPPHNQVILKIILRPSRLFAKKNRLCLYRSSLDNQNFEEYIC